MKKRKRVEPTDNPSDAFDAAVKKMCDEWDEAVKKMLTPLDAAILAIPSFPEYNFPDLSKLIPDAKQEARK
jgi:hypothetical protein